MIIEKLQQIEALQAVETPWHVMRVFGRMSIFGSNICFDDNDYVDAKDMRAALEWLVVNFGGSIVWEDRSVADAPSTQGRGSAKKKKGKS